VRLQTRPNRQEDVVVPLPRTLDYLKPLAIDDLCRLGRDNDGGYILPAAVVSRAEHLVSFGLSWDWSFEKDFKSRNPKLRIDAYDHTVRPRSIVRRAAGAAARAAVLRLPPGDAARTLRDAADYFTIMKHFVRRVSATKQDRIDVTIDEVFRRVPPGKRVFLKMDIEGSEYDVLHEILQHSHSLVGMVIEFHDVGVLRSTFETSVSAILEHFDIVHVHGNNWAGVAEDGLAEVLEVTFLNRAYRPSTVLRREVLPLEIDQPNHPERPDLPILFHPVDG